MKLKLLTHPYFWRELKWNIRDYFSPKSKWLFKKIGNHYCDACGLVDIVLFEILVHFVEVDKGLASIWDDELYADDLEKGYISDDYKKERSEIRNQLYTAYLYIKHERPELEKKHDESYPKPLKPHTEWFVPCEDGSGNSRMLSCEERYGMSFEEAYAEMTALDKQMQDMDTLTMEIIIKNRKYMWT
jgi:hypothetical protein